MLPRSVALLPLLILTGFCRSAGGAEADTAADEEVLRAARLPTEGPGLLMIFRKRTPDAEAQKHITKLIAQLGSASFTEREEASEEFAGYGIEAAGLLRQAARHRDLEIRRRAREALTLVEQGEVSDEVLLSALRLLGRRKPSQMTEVLLAYAPHASSTALVEELTQTLSSVALREGEANPVLVRALKASSARQRGAAAAALCQAGCRKQLPAVRRLLRDPDAHVRYRVALALLMTREKEAVPTLIELLAQLPTDEAEQIESLLLQIAGDTPPVHQAFQPDGPSPRQTGKPDLHDVWAKWWRRNSETIDLKELELTPHWRGYTLAVCMMAMRGRGARLGCLVEFDGRGRTRWQMQGLLYPVDAQVLDERRVLVTEYRSSQVTERNHKGEVLHCIEVPSPLEARRLPNGHTLITTRNRVFEVDRHDKEVWSAKGAGDRGSILSVCPLPGGQLGICYQSGEFVRQDRDGKILASFQVGRLFRPTGTHIQGLPNGHILIPLMYDDKIAEFDGRGREVWSASFSRPTSAQRLPNGRTLVAGYGSNAFVELDRDGREVKSQQCEGRILCVRGR